MAITKLHRDVIFNRICEITQQQPETVAVDDVKQQFQNWALCSMSDMNYDESWILTVFKSARVKKLNYKLINDQLVRRDLV